LEGEASMIDGLVKDVLKRRGQIDEQTETVVKGQIPGASVRGWIKELRVMGMEVDMKFVGY
jgi:translation elongation factor EF-G